MNVLGPAAAGVDGLDGPDVDRPVDCSDDRPADRAVERWWTELTAAAVVGTARRQVPALPAQLGTGRAGVTRETALLDAAALGSALRRAGMRTRRPEPAAVAADDRRTPPPPHAVQLLELLVRQSPVGPTLMPDLVRVWLRTADDRGHRIPHHLLPELLRLATRHQQLRADVRRVQDARGDWLATVNPDWRWARADTPTPVPRTEPVDARAWAHRPTEQRVAEVARLRPADPDTARGLVESTWDTDAAGDRASLLAALRANLTAADEPLLERALDDRSAKVREVAAALLDGLPDSARAARMAARLRRLLRLRGKLRKTLEVDLPLEPDAAGERDGLIRRQAGSVRGWWLQRLAAGAPLAVWTDATGRDPAQTWPMITQPDARAGIVEAVLARRERRWATAIVDDVWHPGLLTMLPAELVDGAAVRQLGAATPAQIPLVVRAVPVPWGPAFSRAVLQRLMAEKDPALLVGQLTVQLATGLDPVTRPALDNWAAGLAFGARERVARVSQYLALVSEIPEAFR